MDDRQGSRPFLEKNRRKLNYRRAHNTWSKETNELNVNMKTNVSVQKRSVVMKVFGINFRALLQHP